MLVLQDECTPRSVRIACGLTRVGTDEDRVGATVAQLGVGFQLTAYFGMGGDHPVGEVPLHVTILRRNPTEALEVAAERYYRQ